MNKLLIKLLIITIIFSILFCVIPNYSSLLNNEGSWSLKNQLFTPRIGHGVVSCNGKIYVIGGYSDGFLDLVEVYDPLNDSWEVGSPMPYGVAEFGVCSVGNFIYVIGGCNELIFKGEAIYPSNVLNDVLVYDTISDSWSFKAPMPTPRNSLALGVVEDKIYAIGGAGLLWNDCCFYLYKALNVNEMYSIKDNSWKSLSSLPTPRHHIGLAVIDNDIFVCGGNKGVALWPANNIMEVYSTKSNTWRTNISLPKNLTEFGISSNNIYIYIIGGICYPEYYEDDVFQYNTLSNQWNNMSPIGDARFGLSACNNNGKIYAIGGATDYGIKSIYNAVNFSDLNEVFTPPIFDINSTLDIKITFPLENTIVSGFINISGTASSKNGNLKNIQIKIDSNHWITINQTEIWSYTWDTTSYDDGNHLISVRSFNGISYSSIDIVNITVNNIQNDKKNIPGFEFILVFYTLLFVLFYKRMKKQ